MVKPKCGTCTKTQTQNGLGMRHERGMRNCFGCFVSQEKIQKWPTHHTKFCSWKKCQNWHESIMWTIACQKCWEWLFESHAKHHIKKVDMWQKPLQQPLHQKHFRNNDKIVRWGQCYLSCQLSHWCIGWCEGSVHLRCSILKKILTLFLALTILLCFCSIIFF